MDYFLSNNTYILFITNFIIPCITKIHIKILENISFIQKNNLIINLKSINRKYIVNLLLQNY